MRNPDIRSAIESLVLCERCTHGIGLHDGAGCAHCGCSLSRELVVEEALEAARNELRTLYSSPTSHARI